MRDRIKIEQALRLLAAAHLRRPGLTPGTRTMKHPSESGDVSVPLLRKVSEGTSLDN